MDFPVAQPILDALKKRVEHGVFGYSRWNHDDFKGAITHWFYSRFSTTINPEMIAYSPSIIYSLSYLIEANSKIGEGVILQTPAYDAFFNTLIGLGRKALYNELRYDIRGNAQINFEQLEQLAKKSKIMLICNPHNPTGRVWTLDEMRKMVAIAKKYHLFIISDDAHMDIIYPGHEYICLARLWGSYPNAALITSTAKGFNTASLGGSYIIFNDYDSRETFMASLKVKGLSSATILGVIATITAYRYGQEWLKAFIAVMQSNLLYIDTILKQHLPKVTIAKPQGSYFAWLNVSAVGLSAEQIQHRLINIGKVAIMDGTIYHQVDPLYIRLNVACPLSKVKNGMARLVKSLEE